MHYLCSAILCLIVSQVGSADQGDSSTEAAVNQVTMLTVEPSEVRLHAASRQQLLLITAHASDGTSWDVSRVCSVKIANPEVAQIDGSLLRAISDGSSRVEVTLGNQCVELPLKVEGCSISPPVHFSNDIVPTFSKLGCNSGGCHGRVQGQNGFKLSVFGYDPNADYDAIVREARGRRVFPGSPPNSLLLLKATATVPHGGGRRMAEDSVEYELLHRWLEQGMPIGGDDAPKLERLEVSPREREMKPGGEQQILATALFSDGSRRDVSHAAQYASNATSVAEVSPHGVVRCGGQSGEAAITINYMGSVSVVRVQRPRSSSKHHSAMPIRNRIDELVQAKLIKMGLQPSTSVDDAAFLRRLYLDVLGTLPTSAEVHDFLADSLPQKRSAVIERALDRPEYADYLALKWADILLVDKEKLGDRGAFEFHRWLREQFQLNRPYDHWVRDIITATGNSGRSGPVNLYRAADAPDALARTISQAFLGVRLECAQCHHHPFDNWSQADFYGLAGFFQGLQRKPLAPDRTLLYHAGAQAITIPLTNVSVTTKPLGAAVAPDLSKGDPRAVLADWLVSPSNPWFARMFANRVWKNLLGRGLVEPEDDMRMTNPSTNEPLLDYLAKQAIESRFDQKALMRMILDSQVYQTSGVPNDSNHEDQQYFSHFYAKRMPAEVLLDAISQTTGVEESFPGQPQGTRALQLWDNRLPSYFLEIFGRPPRNSPCECGRSSEPTMAQALHLTNAPEVEYKLSCDHGRVAKLIAHYSLNDSGRLYALDRDSLIEELCFVSIGRAANSREMRVAAELFESAEPRRAAEDFLWTLLNSYDFLFIQ